MTPEEKHLKKYLKDLVKAVETFLNGLDEEMKKPSTPERGQRIAKLSNDLDYAKDMARFFGLDIDYRTGKERK